MAKARTTVADERNFALRRLLAGQMVAKNFVIADVLPRMTIPMSASTLNVKMKKPETMRVYELWDVCSALGIDSETLKSVF